MITIMTMTWKELLRKRVLVLTLLMTAVFLLAFWFVADTLGYRNMGVFNRSGDIDLIEQFTRGAFILMLGFFFGGFVLAFLAIFSSFSAIAGEAEQGVMQAMLPRPIPRWKWFAGRWLGFVSLGVGYALVLFVSILAVTSAHAGIPRDPALLLRSFLLFASVVPLIISVSMLGSGFFSALGNGVFMTMLYGAGWLGGMIEKLSGSLDLDAHLMQPLNTITGLMSLAMPADAIQRQMLAELLSFDQLTDFVPLTDNIFSLFAFGNLPSASFMIYTAIYGAGAFASGMLRFQRKDL
ncbi:ABC transporter permease [Paenibacillus methanolicus]|uniref:ABC-2 family transporter n=1 Tax=Paenibacillus methanolicus TaxID=582686 RepID=A0A5S5BRF4_9BACL|nr:ABC transporter permease subunit [Paenibacillus methanolicus]TYP69567.1 ABC-2 family transporter [Paenibacillus methanolicus]